MPPYALLKIGSRWYKWVEKVGVGVRGIAKFNKLHNSVGPHNIIMNVCIFICIGSAFLVAGYSKHLTVPIPWVGPAVGTYTTGLRKVLAILGHSQPTVCLAGDRNSLSGLKPQDKTPHLPLLIASPQRPIGGCIYPHILTGWAKDPL